MYACFWFAVCDDDLCLNVMFMSVVMGYVLIGGVYVLCVFVLPLLLMICV